MEHNKKRSPAYRKSYYSAKSKNRRKYYRKKSNGEKFNDTLCNITAVILLIIFVILVFNLLTKKKVNLGEKAADIAGVNISYNDYFNLKELGNKYNLDFPYLWAFYMMENDFFTGPPEVNNSKYIEDSFIADYKEIQSNYYKKDIEPIAEMFRAILEEVKYFPIPKGFYSETGDDYLYSNSWGEQRNYGGNRQHYGTDIIDRQNTPKRIPIISMTKGIIEHIGWNELGGYRIGIRTENGNYYYYAHLSEFAPNLAKGNSVAAGEVLGYMGDTGYSKREGATGNFAVHLHLGIMCNTAFSQEEYWINPYIFLREVEGRRLIIN